MWIPGIKSGSSEIAASAVVAEPFLQDPSPPNFYFFISFVICVYTHSCVCTCAIANTQSSRSQVTPSTMWNPRNLTQVVRLGGLNS